MKNKFTTALLALFFGGIGIHRFYLGQTRSGLLYLLFCWTFIPLAIALFDFFAFLFMSEQKFNSAFNYNTGF
ncbi:TM2 domain-containing protein [Pedobacter sp. SG908]|uniref:TM2 domain-containing protein n=1 Tax=unclassified Pedobacter TaxID=2628915 RepID=UPI00141DEDFE|nr:TM2 domain-containing protein [Pedobacter sp. SG908]